MRLVITGGLGFIGSHVVEEAGSRGHHLIVVDRRALGDVARQPDCADVPDLIDAAGATVVRADVRDAEAMSDGLRGADAVVHLAAKVGLGDGVQDAPDYVAHNDLATATLLRELDRHTIGRLVLASSMVVYGAGLSECAEHGAVRPPERTLAALSAGDFEAHCPHCGEPLSPMLVDENCPFGPANVYAATKVAQEHLCAAWARSTGGSVAALRFHNVYGRRLPADTPYAGVAALFVSMVRDGRPPTVFEDGGQRRDFVHVRDVARAVVTAAELADDSGQTRAYNIGSGVPRTVLDLATTLATQLGGPEPTVTGQFRLGDVRHITASNGRAGRELAWHPTEPYEDSLAELAGALAP